MGYQVDIGDETEAFQEDDEAISLSDFPTCESIPSSHDLRRSSSEPTNDLFEFFSSDDLSLSCCDMSNAEDIISGGKLVPFKQEQPPHRRSESMSELNYSTCKDESKARIRMMQSRRSLDYRNLPRNCSVKSSSSSSCNQKPRWYLFMLGLAKFPAEMELKDIKSRQVRQTRATMFPPGEGSEKQKRSWDLLRVLSCKGPSSVAVVSTTGFGLMPQACHTSYS